jgi:hypothetical protein
LDLIVIGNTSRWSQGVPWRKWHGTGIGVVILAHLLFFLKVANDDNITIVGRPKMTAVEVTEQLAGNFLIP